MKIKNKQYLSFTLIELVLVIALISTVFVFAVPALSNITKIEKLDRAATQVASDLELVRQKGLSGGVETFHDPLVQKCFNPAATVPSPNEWKYAFRKCPTYSTDLSYQDLYINEINLQSRLPLGTFIGNSDPYDNTQLNQENHKRIYTLGIEVPETCAYYNDVKTLPEDIYFECPADPMYSHGIGASDSSDPNYYTSNAATFSRYTGDLTTSYTMGVSEDSNSYSVTVCAEYAVDVCPNDVAKRTITIYKNGKVEITK
jgi:type II secretory pathway pseudopilin PulG